MRGEYQMAHELGEQGLRLAQSVQDPALTLEAYLMLGMTSFFIGDFIPAREYFEQSIALYNPQQHHAHAFLYGLDPGVTCLSYAALVLWCLGYPDQALKRSQEAITLAQQLSHPYSLCMALINTAMFQRYCRDGQTVQKHAEKVVAISTEHGFAEWLTFADIFRGWALAEQGQVQEGIAQLRRGLDAYRGPIGAESVVPWSLSLLAEAYGKGRHVEEGLDTLAEALGMMQRIGERVEEAEVYWVKGVLTLQQFQVSGSKPQVANPQSPIPNPQTEAEACFLEAIAVAQRQQAKSWELRATTSLARLWQQQGKKAEARQMLAEVYGWFTEGFDTKDLQEAKALLDHLT
jgi:predicted ATPase